MQQKVVGKSLKVLTIIVLVCKVLLIGSMKGAKHKSDILIFGVICGLVMAVAAIQHVPFVSLAKEYCCSNCF